MKPGASASSQTPVPYRTRAPMSFAVLFPGQGSQSVGMCADLRADRPDLFASASEVLGWDLSALIDDGPAELLTRTDRAQPALYVTAFGLWEAFSDVAPTPTAAAGHSLGEYTALAAAGALDFAAGLSLVDRRGRAMADAAAASAGGMAALLGADDELAERVSALRRADGGDLHLANANAPGQVVVAGGMADLDWLESNARDLGLRRVIRLDVGGAFHSPHMADAADRLATALADTHFGDASFAVFANADAAPIADPRAALVRQLTAPVRFRESLERMAASGIGTFVHIGPGDVTAGLARRSVPGADVHVVSSIDDAHRVADLLSIQ